MSNTPYVDIIFGQYEPDWGGLPRREMPGYLVDAVNVRSTPNGYRGMPTFADVSSATAIGSSSFTHGVGECFYSDANISFFFVDGTNSLIFESRAEGTDTWQDVTPAAGASVAGFGDLLFFGGDVIYVNSSRAPIKKTLSDSHATLFTDLGGSPPIAESAGVIHQHVVLGNLTGVDVYAVQGCAIGDHEDWPTPGTADARSKQAFRESLNPTYGPVRQILGGEKIGIVVQDTALTRMTYVGGSAVYTFDTYERVDAGGSSGFYSRPVTDGKLWYFYNESGVFATDGYSVQSISEGKIDEALFLNTIGHPDGTTAITTAYTSVYDQRRSLVIFSKNSYTADSNPQLCLAYNVSNGSFSFMQEDVRTAFFAGFRTSGTRNINGRMAYNINGSNRKLQRLSESGAPAIEMQTGYIEVDPGYNVQLQDAHLLGTGTGSLTLAYKTAASSSACDVSQSGFTSMTANPLGQKKGARATAQYMAFRVTGTGAESQLIRGIRVYYNRAQPAT